MSVPFGVAEARAWTGAVLVQGSEAARFTGVSTDSRRAASGALFVALRGPRHDAHDHLAGALAAGAAGLLVEAGRPLPAEAKPELPVLAVADTTRALGALAAGHRAGFAGPLVAVTGSNGKTTTKEMCAAILEVGGPCLRNPGNWNNAIGLPLALLAREPEHRAAVVEIGMNHAGEIAPLAAIARPTVGVLTNVGSAHIEHLGSREAIAAEKGELLAALAPDAAAVVNADDPLALAQAERAPGRVRTFGLSEGADVRARRLESLGAEGCRFEIRAAEGRGELRVAGVGASAAANALAAAAAALEAGAPFAALAEGLARYRPPAGRLAPRALPGGARLLDDTYNASPESTAAALRSLAGLRGSGRVLAVLGEMGELGPAAPEAHREAGALAAALGLDALFAVGAQAERVLAGAREAGMAPAALRAFPDPEAAAEPLRAALRPGDWVLVKGSRAARMERVVERLLDGEAA